MELSSAAGAVDGLTWALELGSSATPTATMATMSTRVMRMR